MKPRLVEFCGLPGSGKSTISNYLFRHLSPKNGFLTRKEALIKAVRKRDDGIFYNKLKQLPSAFWFYTLGKRGTLPEWINFTVKYPMAVKIVFDIVISEEFTDDERFCLLDTFTGSAVEHILLRKHLNSDKTVILDEGIIHRAFTVFGYKEKVDDNAARQFIESCPHPDALIFIKTDPKVCFERLCNRPAALVRMKNVPRDHQVFILQNGERCLQAALKEAKSQGMAVVEIDGALGPEQIVSQLFRNKKILFGNRAF